MEWSWFHNFGPVMEKALTLVDDFQVTLGVATWRSLAWEDLVGQADDTGERHSDK